MENALEEVATRLRLWRTGQHGDDYPIDAVVKRERIRSYSTRTKRRKRSRVRQPAAPFFSIIPADCIRYDSTFIHLRPFFLLTPFFTLLLSRSLPPHHSFVVVRSEGCHAHRTNAVVVVGPHLFSFLFILGLLLFFAPFLPSLLFSTPFFFSSPLSLLSF